MTLDLGNQHYYYQNLISSVFAVCGISQLPFTVHTHTHARAW